MPDSKGRPLGSEIEKGATKWAKEQGWFSFKVAMTNKRGVPDRFYSRNGKAVFVEFKGAFEVVSEPQKRRIREIVASGLDAWVCRDLADFKWRMR